MPCKGRDYVHMRCIFAFDPISAIIYNKFHIITFKFILFTLPGFSKTNNILKNNIKKELENIHFKYTSTLEKIMVFPPIGYISVVHNTLENFRFFSCIFIVHF